MPDAEPGIQEGFTIMTTKNIIPLSTVDWYGRAATVVFLMGCPFRCTYCQNHALLEMGKLTSEPADVEAIKSEIAKNSLLISAVVFTGGEAFQQFDALRSLAEFACSQGLMVGVETNGYYTDRIRQAIEERLVDLICMDVKAPLEPNGAPYLKICGIDAAHRVSESLKLYKLCRENKRGSAVLRELTLPSRCTKKTISVILDRSQVLCSGGELSPCIQMRGSYG